MPMTMTRRDPMILVAPVVALKRIWALPGAGVRARRMVAEIAAAEGDSATDGAGG